MIQKEIKDPLSEEVLYGRLEKGGRVRIDASDGEFLFEFPSKVPA